MVEIRPIEILLVEDSPSDALMTREALRQAKVLSHLHLARTAEEALAFLHRRDPWGNASRPDVILLDLNLPGKSGRELLAEIKEEESLQAIPVVVLTTSQAEEDVLDAYRHHANCYVPKPMGFESMVEVVKAISSFWFAVVKLPPEQR